MLSGCTAVCPCISNTSGFLGFCKPPTSTPSALSGYKAPPLHCWSESGLYIAEVADCGEEMLLSGTCLSSHSSHPLIHKISNIWGTIYWPALTFTHAYAHKMDLLAHVHKHTLWRHAHAQITVAYGDTHISAQRASFCSHPPLVRAWTFLYQSCSPQMMYLRHLAALAIFMDTERQRVKKREREREEKSHVGWDGKGMVCEKKIKEQREAKQRSTNQVDTQGQNHW